VKAAVFHGPLDLRLEEFASPVAGVDDVVVKVHACGVCGSDLHGYKKGYWVEPGEVMGHEWAGEVVSLGENVRHLHLGDRVTVGDPAGALGAGWERGVGYGLPGAYAELVRIPNAHIPGQVGILPDNISYNEAATMEPLRCALHALKLAPPQPGSWAVIIGLGTIGLNCLQVFRAVGKCRTIAIDISDRRLALAEQFGAEYIVNARREDALERVAEITGSGHYKWGSQSAGKWSLGASADTVIEAAGTPGTLKQALEMVRVGGTVIQIALFEEEVSLDPTIITQKQIRLQGSAGLGLAPFPEAAELVSNGVVDLKPLVTHRFPLEEITSAFEMQMNTAESGKVVVSPTLTD